MMLLAVFFAGLCLGGIFFGGLWWTVRRALHSPHPARWFLSSLLLRSGTVVGGFYLLADTDWQRWLACVAAFMLARQISTRYTRIPPIGDTHHAPQP